MKPQIGQRWKYTEIKKIKRRNQKTGNAIIVQIMDNKKIAPKVICLQLIGELGSWENNIEQDCSIGEERNRWTYLENQDAPL